MSGRGPPGPAPLGPAAVVLHVEPAGRVVVARDLVDALAELGIRVGVEAGADAVVRRLEGLAAVLAQVVAAGRDAEVHAVAAADDRVHAQAAVAGLPLAGVLVVADAFDHLPGVAAVAAAEQRGRLDAAQQILLAGARLRSTRCSRARGRRPSGNAGADFVSLNFLPRSVERSTFMPKNGLQLDA